MNILTSISARLFLSAVTIFCGLLSPAYAQTKPQETNVVLHSTITGNQEQPKVLYIVPWQPPGSADQLMQSVQPLLSDVFAPVDRSEFQRELKYRADSAQTHSSP